MPHKCLVIDDDVTFAQAVMVTRDEIRAGDIIPLVENYDSPATLNLDGEGVAFSKGNAGRPDYFYIIGSHGGPRKEGVSQKRFDDQVAASSKLIRLQVDESTIDNDGKVAVPPDFRTFINLGEQLREVAWRIWTGR